MGNALDSKSDIGAIISDEQLKRTLHYMDIAKKTSSAKVLHGGNQPKGGDYKEGFFYEPTLLSGVPVESPVCQEEVFGPVACAIPFKSFDEVMKSANDTPFGLSAVLWTQNLSRALQFVDEIEAGFVQVNQCVAPRANVSYGGIKMSGLGKEYAFDSMMNHFIQTVVKSLSIVSASPTKPIALATAPIPSISALIGANTNLNATPSASTVAAAANNVPRNNLSQLVLISKDVGDSIGNTSQAP